ncbi:3'(2'),5'-bisphosphate nucleotidase [gamma proteobacterium HTCC5015]|nr:3'(2'),5'-bisphosphate nucleotidase [gamma proteobacterium HTCC5015]
MFDWDALPSLQKQVEAIAERAGQAILNVYHGDYEVEQKADKTPVTEADWAANDVIEQGLRQLEPQWPILSEEGEAAAFEQRQQWQTYWLVDPLDGTKEFIKGNGEFSVNIALIHYHQPVLGVVHAPVLGATYSASKDNGAEKITQSGRAPISTAAVGGAARIAASRSHRSDRLLSYLNRLGEHSMVHMGSSLKSCLVAEGKADLYPRLGKTSEWDTGACQCVVEEAGGFFVTSEGERMTYNRKSSLLNPEFFVFGDDSRDWLAYLD